MTMMNSNKKEDNKKYVQMSPDTVSMLAESVGISGISGGVSRALAEDVSYRCRELASICGQLMRHSKRRKLTAEDVQRALKWYEAPPTFGHQHQEDLEQSLVQIHGDPASSLGNRSCESLFAPDEQLIDLHEYSMNVEGEEYNEGVQCQVSWLALEGSSSSGSVLENSKSNNHHLSPQLMQYYTALTGVICSDASSNAAGKEIRDTLIKDVQTNSKLGPLIPLLVSFVGNGVQRHSDNQTLVKRLLCLIEAIFLNPYLNLSPKPFLSHLVTALLSILKSDKRDNHLEHAAQVLRMALTKWATPVNQLKHQTHKALREYLNDPKSSWASQFGTLTALCHLGPEVLIECVLPQMDRYLTSIEAKLSFQGLSSKEEDGKNWLQTLHGTLLLASRSILDHLAKQITCQDAILEVYAMMFKHFGDALFFSQSSPSISTLSQTTGTLKSCSSSALSESPSRLKIRPLQAAPMAINNRFGNFFGEDSPMINGWQAEELMIKFSPSSNQEFECVNHGIDINPKIVFNVRSLVAWPEDRLKRRKFRLQHSRHHSNFKSFGGCIGKRLGVKNLARSSRQKMLSSYPSSLTNLIL